MEISKQYGDLKCIEFIGKNSNGHKVYKMKCTICGREKDMKDYVVRQERGITHKACGKGLKTINKTFYSRWQSMRTRTTNENYWATHRYMGRGINSDEFEYFIDFYDSMYDSFIEHSKIHGEKNTSLERIDNNKPYSRSNCKWVTLNEQKENQEKVKIFKAISPNGEEFVARNVTKFCKTHNLDRCTVSDVLNGRSKHHKNWKFEYIEQAV